MKEIHRPVLLQEVVDGLSITPGKTYIDATLGFGGHSEAILASGGRVVGIDQDKTALASATKRLQAAGEHFTTVWGNFRDIDLLVTGVAVDGGILADIGVSSYQLDIAERGFSFKSSGPLDMRMDMSATLTASTVVNQWSERDIARIIREYGEEKFSGRIAKRIILARAEKHIDTTEELASVVAGAIPRKFWPDHISPATKTFQAIRIAVNDELGALGEFLPKATDLLLPGARLAVITFHSLEDRIVKEFMRDRANPCTCPKEFPKCICGKTADVKVITKKPITATENEITENPRSRSAKLRILEKITK